MPNTKINSNTQLSDDLTTLHEINESFDLDPKDKHLLDELAKSPEIVQIITDTSITREQCIQQILRYEPTIKACRKFINFLSKLDDAMWLTLMNYLCTHPEPILQNIETQNKMPPQLAETISNLKHTVLIPPKMEPDLEKPAKSKIAPTVS